MANMNVTYEDMQQAATKLTSGKEDITAKLNDLKAYIAQLVSTGFVTDKASGTFNSTYENFTQGATQTISALDGLSSYLNKAASTLADTDSQLAGQIG